MIQIDMEMPDSCGECYFSKYNPYSGQTDCIVDGGILARYFKPIDFEGRAEDCPLIDAPEWELQWG